MQQHGAQVANLFGLWQIALLQAMAYIETSGSSARERRPFGQALKRAAIALLFTVILMIPRLRRLRRKTRAWTVLRVCAAVLGAWLIERFAVSGGGAESMAGGILLVAFAALIRARPEKKSTDAAAGELRALVVLNGGAFLNSPGGEMAHNVRLAVSSERFTVLGPDEKLLAEIRFSELREIFIEPIASHASSRKKFPARHLRIRWESPQTHTARFRYEGFFAEHLAEIAERTLRSVWKKELPVLRS